MGLYCPPWSQKLLPPPPSFLVREVCPRSPSRRVIWPHFAKIVPRCPPWRANGGQFGSREGNLGHFWRCPRLPSFTTNRPGSIHESYISVNGLINPLAIPGFYDPEKEAFENIVGKGENAGNQHFLLFTQCFQFFSYVYFVVCKCFQLVLV